MPLALAAVIAWVGGTALGLTQPVAPSLLALGLGGALILALRPRPEPAVPLLLVALAGALLGTGLRARDARCLREAQHAARFDVRVAHAASAGSFTRAALAAPRCAALGVTLFVRSGRAEAGSRVRLEGGERSVEPRGLLVREARLMVREGPGPLSRWRNRVAAALDRRFGPEAGVVKALLIADTRDLTPELRERFADAGLVHILSISGLHVSIIGESLLLLFGVVRLGAVRARVAAVIVTALYVLAIGAPPPAVRSLGLFAVVALSRLLQRPVSPWSAFALGGALPLVQPRTVLDLGWQLSVGGYAALIAAGRLARRWEGTGVGSRPPRWRNALRRELVAGILTTVATAPLIAWVFGRISLIGPLANLVAAPLVAVLQPTLFLAMVVEPISPLAALSADAAKPMLRALDALAQLAAGVPGASVVVAPTLSVALASGVGAGAVVVAASSRHFARPLSVALAALALAVWWPERGPRGSHEMELHLLDVGQGDAVAVRSPAGRWILVDAGRGWRGGDVARSTIIPYLRRRGGHLALLVLSHPHADHIGGAASIVRALRPPEIRDAAFAAGSESYARALAMAQQLGARWQRVRPRERMVIDGVELDFLAPDSAWTASLRDPNEASVVLRIRYGRRAILLTGDAERAEEEWLLTHAAERLRADVLKVAHHGSPTSSTPPFLAAVAPRIALVSVGALNAYGHPGPVVMQRLRAQGALILRTDQLGTVRLRTDGSTLTVEAAGHRWTAAR